jgi:DNA-binding NtrC family response regulator
VIRQAQRTGRPVVWSRDSEAHCSESFSALGITAALAAPLRAVSWRVDGGEGERLETEGALYVDCRDVTKWIGETHVEFLDAAARLLSVVLEQGHQLRVASEYVRKERAKGLCGRAVPTLSDLLGPPSMERIRREVAACLASDVPILIEGESGTGKTVLAHAIAEASGRAPVVRATLGASDDLNTITSELFGHERGAFTGALAKRVGLVEFADGGTLILDEVLNLPHQAQQLLLDFTQFGTYRPLGHASHEPKRANARIIAATNGDVRAAIERGVFRKDLYYRLAGLTLQLPPLRDRREDLPALAEGFLRRIDPVRQWSVSLPLRRLLVSEELTWPGNIRELEHVLQKARDRALARNPSAADLSPEHVEPSDLGRDALPREPGPHPRPQRDLLCSAFEVDTADPAGSWRRLVRERGELESHERAIIAAALERHGGVVAHAAAELGISRTGLLSRMQTLKVARPGRRGSEPEQG